MLVLPFQTLHGLEDAQSNFETITVYNPLQASANLSDIASISAARRNLGIYVTLATVTFSASTLSATTSITHNLGRIPAAILMTYLGTDPGFVVMPIAMNGGSTTTATIQARAASSNSLTLTYSVAIIG